MLRVAEPHFPRRSRRRAWSRPKRWVSERLNGEDGLGAIYPAMAYSALMYEALGGRGRPRLGQVLRAIERLLVEHEDEAYLQPCVSPVWDTALACHALIEAGAGPQQRASRPGSTG